MILKVDASFENGVFVPSPQPRLADRQRVRLTIEPAGGTLAETKSFDECADSVDQAVRTAGGLAIALDFHPDGC